MSVSSGSRPGARSSAGPWTSIPTSTSSWSRAPKSPARFCATGPTSHDGSDRSWRRFPQWIEDRFWVWVHYVAIDALEFVRARVLGPLILSEAGGQPNGVRRVEQTAPGRVAALRSTLASHDRPSCWRALIATLTLYSELRERLAPPTLQRRAETEHAVRDFLEVARPSASPRRPV